MSIAKVEFRRLHYTAGSGQLELLRLVLKVVGTSTLQAGVQA